MQVLKFLCLLLLCCSSLYCTKAQDPTYRNLVFEGGGVRGLAYAGALDVLEERGALKKLEQVAGTSVGAVTALLIAVGYTPTELRNVMEELRDPAVQRRPVYLLRWFLSFLPPVRLVPRRAL
jgi:NTE family protein